MPIPNVVWVLPRPKKNKYKGGFPLWFEEKILKHFGYDYKTHDLKDRVCHMFAGMTKYGFRIDLKPEVNPDMIGDCHELPLPDNMFELVILDPPYNNELSKTLYNTGKLKYKDYIKEAVRICKPEGHIVMYHWVITPRPQGTKFVSRIVVLTRVWHRPRVCCIFQKEITKNA